MRCASECCRLRVGDMRASEVLAVSPSGVGSDGGGSGAPPAPTGPPAGEIREHYYFHVCVLHLTGPKREGRRRLQARRSPPPCLPAVPAGGLGGTCCSLGRVRACGAPARFPAHAQMPGASRPGGAAHPPVNGPLIFGTVYCGPGRRPSVTQASLGMPVLRTKGREGQKNTAPVSAVVLRPETLGVDTRASKKFVILVIKPWPTPQA